MLTFLFGFIDVIAHWEFITIVVALIDDAYLYHLYAPLHAILSEAIWTILSSL